MLHSGLNHWLLETKNCGEWVIYLGWKLGEGLVG